MDWLGEPTLPVNEPMSTPDPLVTRPSAATSNRRSGITPPRRSSSIGAARSARVTPTTAWAVDRLLRNPGRLVTVLSNSRENGAEFVPKAREVCDKLGQAIEIESNQAQLDGDAALPEDVKYENMRFEVRLTVDGKVGRLKVLAANPRTARGFSGDLILDEFAFHEDSAAIWEGGGTDHLVQPGFPLPHPVHRQRSAEHVLPAHQRGPHQVPWRIRRSDAWAMGELKIYSQVDGRRDHSPSRPARQSSDKRAYDQNYECAFEDENAPLLTQELISAAEPRRLVPPHRPADVDPPPAWRGCAPRRADSKPGWTWAVRGILSVLTVLVRGRRRQPPGAWPGCWRWTTCACLTSNGNSTWCARWEIFTASRST